VKFITEAWLAKASEDLVRFEQFADHVYSMTISVVTQGR